MQHGRLLIYRMKSSFYKSHSLEFSLDCRKAFDIHPTEYKTTWNEYNAIFKHFQWVISEKNPKCYILKTFVTILVLRNILNGNIRIKELLENGKKNACDNKMLQVKL